MIIFIVTQIQISFKCKKFGTYIAVYTKQHLKCLPELVSGSINIEIPKQVRNDSMTVF